MSETWKIGEGPERVSLDFDELLKVIESLNASDRAELVRIMQNTDEIQPGDTVKVGDITGVVEELIYARHMDAPMARVEWWHEGELSVGRFHVADLEKQL